HDLLWLLVPRLLRGCSLGRARRTDHPVDRRVLRLARANAAHRRAAAAYLRQAVFCVSVPRRADLRQSRATRSPVLRVVPGGGRPLEPGGGLGGGWAP